MCKTSTRFTNQTDNKKELASLYDIYNTSQPINSNGIEADYKHFQKFVLHIIPSWGRNDLLERFWKMLQKAKFIDFNELIINLSILEKGTLAEQLQCNYISYSLIMISNPLKDCMKLYDEDGDGRIDLIQLCEALEGLKYLHKIEDTSAELNMLAGMLFDKQYESLTFETNTKIMLTFEEIEQELINKPILEEYLQLTKKANLIRTTDNITQQPTTTTTTAKSNNFFRRYSVAF
jgi:Ca2+-binding EF-hand superfamily protein